VLLMIFAPAFRAGAEDTQRAEVFEPLDGSKAFIIAYPSPRFLASGAALRADLDWRRE
jgi:hypothetical protein